ncbi:MAG: RNA-guided pseudouridylation complex pseudouridine synthase subunit Cbf5 [Halobacteriaceae archaeon]
MIPPAPDVRTLEELKSFGVINLDKPPGPTSHQVSTWIRELTESQKAAHAGTLDPKVTGCLPVFLNRATRVIPALQTSVKTYIAVLEVHKSIPPNFESIIQEFEGEIYQKPPQKSAVKRELRTREIHNIDILETQQRKILLQIRCASGTYIRKLCHDIGLVLGTGAHMGDLRRIETTPFDDRDLSTLHEVADGMAEYRQNDNADWIRDVLEPGETALSHLPSITIAPSAAQEVANGAPVYSPGIIDIEGDPNSNSLVACYTPNATAICIGNYHPDATSDDPVVTLERVLVPTQS